MSLGPARERLPPGEAPTVEELNKFFVSFEIPMHSPIKSASGNDIIFVQKMMRKKLWIERLKFMFLILFVISISALIGFFAGLLLFQ